MTNNEIISFASKAMGNVQDNFDPVSNSLDTSAMCAKLDISTLIYKLSATVECFTENNGSLAHSVIKHDGTPEGKEAAWRLAASMVGAKVGGYTG